MNPANALTLMRIVLIPFIIAAIMRYTSGGNENVRIVAFVLFAVAAASDILDGMVARKFRYVTKFGSLFDGAADKFLTVSVLITLYLIGKPFGPVPRWYVAIILAREISGGIGSLTLWNTVAEKGFKPLILGKISTIMQNATIMWLLLLWRGSHVLFIVSGAIVALAGAAYLCYWINIMTGKNVSWKSTA